MAVEHARSLSLGRKIAIAIAVGLLCHFAGRVGLSYTTLSGSVSVLWMPAGIALAATLLLGPWVIPAVFLGSFFRTSLSPPTLTEVCAATGSALAPLVARWLLGRFVWDTPSLDRVRYASGFLVLGVVAPALCSAVPGSLAFWWFGRLPPENLLLGMFTWWIGDTLGALLIAPAAIALATSRVRIRGGWRMLEAAALIVALGLSAALVFLQPSRASGAGYAISSLCLPPLLWAALRFGTIGATLSSLMLSAVAVGATLGALGPFHLADPHMSLLLVAIFLLAGAGTALFIGAASEESLAAVREARREGTLRRDIAAALETLASGGMLEDVLSQIILAVESQSRGLTGSVLLLDEAAGRLRDGAGPRLPPEYRAMCDGLAIGPEVGCCGSAAFLKERTVAADIDTDPRWRDFRSDALRFGLRACWSTPILGANARVLGTFAMYYDEPRTPSLEEIRLVDIAVHIARIAIERVESESAVRRSEERLRTLIENLQVGVAVQAPDLSITLANPTALSLLGRTESQILGRTTEDPMWDIIHEDGRVFQASTLPAAVALATRRPVENVVMGIRRPDRSERVWLLVSAHPEVSPDQHVRRIVVTFTDITERRAIELRQALMMEELDHRVKNNLASILALAETSSHNAGSLEEFRHSFVGRVRALGQVHSLLAQTSWSGVRLDELVRLVLEAFADPDHPRVVVEGPACMLPARAAPPLCMALHELATNASKYGSLSVPLGSVTVRWSISGTTDQPRSLDLIWTERGGPVVRQPEGRGFGTSLIEGAIGHQLGGRVSLEFDPEGVRCALSVDLTRMREGEPTPSSYSPGAADRPLAGTPVIRTAANSPTPVG